MKHLDSSLVRLFADTKHSAIETRRAIAQATTHPFSTYVSGEAPIDVIREELGPGGTIVAEQRLRGSGGLVRLVEGDGWLVEVRSGRPPEVSVNVSTTDACLLDKVADHFQRSFPKPPVESNSVAVTFAYDDQPHSKQTVHRVTTSSWEEVARNYPSVVRPRIDDLVNVERPGNGGRLVLLHGPPGTGKSHLLRTLAWEWSSWADTVVVTDPEAMLTRTAYLHELLARHPGGGRWMLLVTEDAAELIGETRHSRMHPGLAKMLNLSDGMLGEALGLVIAITTNEPLSRIHPAITRPGRCLANLHIGGVDRQEARRRLGPDAALPGDGDVTLAEIIEIEQQGSRIDAPATVERVGQYL